jgi:hypothetical protein
MLKAPIRWETDLKSAPFKQVAYSKPRTAIRRKGRDMMGR